MPSHVQPRGQNTLGEKIGRNLTQKLLKSIQLDYKADGIQEKIIWTRLAHFDKYF